MKKLLVIISALALLSSCGSVVWSSLEWNKIPADGHRTGVTAPGADNPEEALGVSNGDFYMTPGGKIMVGGITPKVAQILYDAQPAMADLKTVIGHSARGMKSKRPESPLSDWTVDVLMQAAEEYTGIRPDVGITNFGGIRTDIPQGEILKDDMVSMFPFRNYVTLVTLPGWRLREIFTQMAGEKVQVVGGVKLVIKGKQLESVLVGGEPLDDSKTYNLATIDFLLNGGDGLHLGEGALQIVKTDAVIGDVMMARVLKLEAEGKTVDYQTDGRVTIIK